MRAAALNTTVSITTPTCAALRGDEVLGLMLPRWLTCPRALRALTLPLRTKIEVILTVQISAVMPCTQRSYQLHRNPPRPLVEWSGFGIHHRTSWWSVCCQHVEIDSTCGWLLGIITSAHPIPRYDSCICSHKRVPLGIKYTMIHFSQPHPTGHGARPGQAAR